MVLRLPVDVSTDARSGRIADRKELYPSCQSNSRRSEAQRDELALIVRTKSETAIDGLMLARMCRWSSTPLTLRILPWVFRAMPQRYRRSSSRIRSLISGRRCFVLQTM